MAPSKKANQLKKAPADEAEPVNAVPAEDGILQVSL